MRHAQGTRIGVMALDRSDVVTLISKTKTQDDYGVWRTTETSRTVYAQVDSVTRQEFFEGGRNGLNPEYRFTMFRFDYEGETIAEYGGNRYSVYRTYIGRNDTIELYVERKGGTNAPPVITASTTPVTTASTSGGELDGTG